MASLACAIRTGSKQAGVMKAIQTPRVVKSMKKHPFKGRGQIYKWLRKWHRTLVDTFEETEAGWAVVVDDMIRDGVVGSRGSPPNPKSAAKVWARVCRDIEARERERLVGASPKRASTRAPKGWTPPVVAKPTFSQTEPAPFAPIPNKQEAAKPAGAGPRDMLAELWSDIDKRSGR